MASVPHYLSLLISFFVHFVSFVVISTPASSLQLSAFNLQLFSFQFSAFLLQPSAFQLSVFSISAFVLAVHPAGCPAFVECENRWPSRTNPINMGIVWHIPAGLSFDRSADLLQNSAKGQGPSGMALS